MRIESKKMQKGLLKWFKTVVYRDTEYYSVVDYNDGSKLVNLLSDQEGRVFRIILSREDVDRIFRGKDPIEAKKVTPQHQKTVIVPPSNPEPEGEIPEMVDILDLFPGQ